MRGCALEEDEKDEIRNYYNGYKAADKYYELHEKYNAFSINNYAHHRKFKDPSKRSCENHWKDTGKYFNLDKLYQSLSEEDKISVMNDLTDLLKNKTITIKESLSGLSVDIKTRKDLWIHSAHCGYLTIDKVIGESPYSYEMKIPNQETK